jgi:hypothetical protein
MTLSKAQSEALKHAVRGKWLFYYEIFPYWVLRQEWTALRLTDLGYFEWRLVQTQTGMRDQFRVKESDDEPNSN